MTAGSQHLGDALQDLLDQRLAGAQRDYAEAHLRACEQCRWQLESLRRVKQAVTAHAARQAVPAHLSSAVAQALDREDLLNRRAAVPPRIAQRPKLRWAMGFGLAATAAFVAVVLWSARPPGPASAPGQALPAAVAADFAAFRAGELTLAARTAEPQELERFFAAQGLGFEARVFDLAMMNYRVAGGRIHQVGGRPSALFVYQGPNDARLLCQMYEGTLAELPPATETLEHNGITFQVYRQGELTAVFWPEGKVICVLVSDLDPADVIRLAFAKAVPVAV